MVQAVVIFPLRSLMERMQQSEIEATNKFFNEVMAWYWVTSDQKKELDKLVPHYLSRPTGAVHDPNLRLDKEGNVWRFSRHEDGTFWTQLVRSDASHLSPYRSNNRRVAVDINEATKEAVTDSSRELQFIKHSAACLPEDWCWEMKTRIVTPFSKLMVEITSLNKAIFLGDLIVLKRDDIHAWMLNFARREDIRPGRDNLINVYRQFSPGLEVDSTEMPLFYPEKVCQALNAALTQLLDIHRRS